MNGAECLVELHTPLIGLDKVSVVGGVSSNVVKGTECSHIGVLVQISAAAASNAAEQVSVVLKSVTSANGNATTIPMDGVWIVTGGPLVKDGTGRMTFAALADAASYTTALADGTKEILLYFRIRSRQLTGTNTHVRVDLGLATNARSGHIMFFREWENAGPSASRDFHP